MCTPIFCSTWSTWLRTEPVGDVGGTVPFSRQPGDHDLPIGEAEAIAQLTVGDRRARHPAAPAARHGA
jgi:hypothetical protein